MTGSVDHRSRAVETAVAALAPLTVDELVARADLQTRVDRKYLTRPDVVASLLDVNGRSLRALDVDGRRWFEYRSLYFDTPDLESFHGAAHGHRRRFKVRLRSYLWRDEVALEVKTRGRRGITVKSRLPVDAALAADQRLDDVGREFVAQHLGEQVARRLAPVVVTSYRRATLADNDGTSRTTIDVDVRTGRVGSPLTLALDAPVVETKTAGHATFIDRRLWELAVRPQRLSKFAIAMVLADDALPSNRWHRVLQQVSRGR